MENQHERWAKRKGDDRAAEAAMQMRPEVASRPPGGKDPEASWVDGPGHEGGCCALSHTRRDSGHLRSQQESLLRLRPAGLCVLGVASPPARASGPTCGQGHRPAVSLPFGGAGAGPELPPDVPLEDAGRPSQEASAQFSNQVEVRGP